MAKKKPSHSRLDSEPYRIFESNLEKLAYFLGATEQYYGKQVRILAKQVRMARKELPVVEIEMGELLKRSKLSEADERKFTKLVERADDLTDIDIFVPKEAKHFRQFPELIRVLGLSYLVTIFDGYIEDIADYLGEREVKKHLHNKRFSSLMNYFDKKFNIKLNASVVSDTEIEKIEEIRATRNIHVHNRGMVDSRYLKSVGDSRLKEGAYKAITRKYLRDSINSIRNLAEFIHIEVQRKYFANQDTKKMPVSSQTKLG